MSLLTGLACYRIICTAKLYSTSSEINQHTKGPANSARVCTSGCDDRKGAELGFCPSGFSPSILDGWLGTDISSLED